MDGWNDACSWIQVQTFRGIGGHGSPTQTSQIAGSRRWGQRVGRLDVVRNIAQFGGRIEHRCERDDQQNGGHHPHAHESSMPSKQRLRQRWWYQLNPFLVVSMDVINTNQNCTYSEDFVNPYDVRTQILR